MSNSTTLSVAKARQKLARQILAGNVPQEAREVRPALVSGGYVVIGHNPATGRIEECVTLLYSTKRAKSTCWLWGTNTAGGRSWSFGGEAGGGGYNRELAAFENAISKMIGEPFNARVSGGSLNAIEDGLAALAIASGYEVRLIVQI